MRPIQKRFLYLLMILIPLILFLIVFFRLDQGEAVEPADVIVVPEGAPIRSYKAVDLLQDGYVASNKIIVSGANGYNLPHYFEAGAESKQLVLENEVFSGNWGAMYPAEQDIAIEEASPYNNRRYLMVLLHVEGKYRTRPDCKVYQKMMEYLWSDTLSEPINSVAFSEKMKQTIGRHLPYNVKEMIKKIY